VEAPAPVTEPVTPAVVQEQSASQDTPVAEPAKETQEAPVQGDKPESVPPEDYIRRASQEYNAGRIESGLSILTDFAVHYPLGTDEAWWLYAQLLEANSPSRDINLSLEYYRRLVRDFPQSNRVADAQRRIAYLERFFINIW
jgi:TolA-binding protein